MIARLAPLFEEPIVTDVVFNRFDTALVKVGSIWVPAASPFNSETDFADWLVDLFESAGSRLDFQNPANSAVVSNFRVHAVIGAGLTVSPVATIRKLRAPALRFAHQDVATAVRLQTLLHAANDRKNVLIAGAAGAGKTTLLRHLLSQFESERILTIEDVPELQLDSPATVSLTTRTANTEAQGEISMQRLLFEALRMSPDRIVVGEVRGGELLTMLDALNTGHTGAGATIHANSLELVAARLTSIGLASGLSERALALQVSAAFSTVAFVSNRDGYRIEALGEFRIGSGGFLEVVRIE